MPVMDGFTATEQIRQQSVYKDLPIIAMTANAETEAAERFVKAGINEVLAKPFDKTELKYCIERWL